MTEAEWLTATDRAAMFAFLRDRVSDRKLRLYLCAGCRAVWHLLVRPESRKAVEVAERFADQEATAAELDEAAYWAEADTFLDLEQPWGFSVRVAWLAHYAVNDPPLFRYDPESSEPYGFTHWCTSRLATMSEIAWPGRWLSDDIFGNPFRPVAFAPEWRTSTVVALAGQMYESRDFAAMPILADALQDAGCDNADILDHCRDTKGGHVRGCWVVDLVLGKT